MVLLPIWPTVSSVQCTGSCSESDVVIVATVTDLEGGQGGSLILILLKYIDNFNIFLYFDSHML